MKRKASLIVAHRRVLNPDRAKILEAKGNIIVVTKPNLTDVPPLKMRFDPDTKEFYAFVTNTVKWVGEFVLNPDKEPKHVCGCQCGAADDCIYAHLERHPNSAKLT